MEVERMGPDCMLMEYMDLVDHMDLVVVMKALSGDGPAEEEAEERGVARVVTALLLSKATKKKSKLLLSAGILMLQEVWLGSYPMSRMAHILVILNYFDIYSNPLKTHLHHFENVVKIYNCINI